MLRLSLPDLSVLLVEPAVSQRRAIRRHLEHHEVGELLEADTGAAAMQVLAARRVGLVISSMYLPDMTAADLLLAIRDSGDHAATPFMLVSGEVRWEQLEPIRQAGVIAILPRPFSGAALRRALLNTLQFVNPDLIELDFYDPEMLRVLVVDDVAYGRVHIGRVLGTLGITRTTFASNGREAAQLLSQQEFDLIITDCNMPQMDGLELTQWLRRELGDDDTPIILVTSERNQARLAAIRQSGVSAVCDKPFEASEVKQLIHRALQS